MGCLAKGQESLVNMIKSWQRVKSLFKLFGRTLWLLEIFTKNWSISFHTRYIDLEAWQTVSEAAVETR